MNKKHLILVLILILTSCVTLPPPSSSIQTQQVTNIPPTSPNWDYISFSDMYGYPDSPQNAAIIGNAIYLWEQSHPDREVVSLQILQQHDGYAVSAKVIGISIYSKLTNP